MLKRARYKLDKFFEELSSHSNYLPEDSVKEVYYGFIKMIGRELQKKGRVICPDLGEFTLLRRQPHMARSVVDGQIRMLPEQYLVKFKPCRKMKSHFHSLEADVVL